MRLNKTILGLFAVLLAMPCLGEEIIVFKSGQEMPIVSHTIREGMVHANLGENGFVAFPLATIESIDAAGKNVILKQSTLDENFNRRVPSTAGNFPVGGMAPRKPDYEILAPQPGDDVDSNVRIDDKTKMAVYYPMANSTGVNKRRFGVTGDMRALGGNEIRHGDGETTFGGTTPVGNRHVIGGVDPRRSNNPRQPGVPQLVSIELKPGVANGTRTERSDPGGHGSGSKGDQDN